MKRDFTKKVFIISSIILIILIGVLFLIMRLSSNGLSPWYHTRVDVTELHTLYVETKEPQTLEELEQKLQSKNISYDIKKKKLCTKILKYDIANKDSVSIIKNKDMIKSFDAIDERDLSKVEVDVKYKKDKKVETITCNNVETINDRYYFSNNIAFAMYVLMLLFTAAYVVFMLYLKKH